jgi:hypothetical protein
MTDDEDFVHEKNLTTKKPGNKEEERIGDRGKSVATPQPEGRLAGWKSHGVFLFGLTRLQICLIVGGVLLQPV